MSNHCRSSIPTFAALREIHTWLDMECVWPANAEQHAKRWMAALEAAIATKLRRRTVSEHESLFSPRVVVLRLVFRPETEEWAEDLLRETADSYGVADKVERTEEGLVLTHRVGGNCSAIYNAKEWLDDIDNALREGEIVPMEFVLTVRSEEPS